MLGYRETKVMGSKFSFFSGILFVCPSACGFMGVHCPPRRKFWLWVKIVELYVISSTLGKIRPRDFR